LRFRLCGKGRNPFACDQPGRAHPIFFGHATARGIPPIDDFGPKVVFEAASDGEQGVGARFRPAAPLPLYPKNVGCALLDRIRRDSANLNGLEEEQNNDGNGSCRPLNSIRTAMIGPKLELSSIMPKLMRFMAVSNERVLGSFPHPVNPRFSLGPYVESSVIIPSFRPTRMKAEAVRNVAESSSSPSGSSLRSDGRRMRINSDGATAGDVSDAGNRLLPENRTPIRHA